jgi:flagellar motor component MotA
MSSLCYYIDGGDNMRYVTAKFGSDEWKRQVKELFDEDIKRIKEENRKMRNVLIEWSKLLDSIEKSRR